jgi:hypothetical protein
MPMLEMTSTEMQVSQSHGYDSLISRTFLSQIVLKQDLLCQGYLSKTASSNAAKVLAPSPRYQNIILFRFWGRHQELLCDWFTT